MAKATKLAAALSSLCLLAGCANKVPPADYSALKIENPHSILVVPAVNRSNEVTAPNYYLTTVPFSIVERGYYVFPVNLVKRVLEDDGLSDADLVHQGDPTRLGELFGADAILYVTIERWDARYLLVSTTVTVDFSYVLKSGKTGETLWQNKVHTEYTPQSTNTGNPIANLVIMAVQAAMAKAAPDYTPLALQANAIAINTPDHGLPLGPRNPKYQGGDGNVTVIKQKEQTSSSNPDGKHKDLLDDFMKPDPKADPAKSGS